MAHAMIDIVNPTTFGISVVILVFAVVIELAAFMHCLFQRRDAFNAVSTLPKGLWVALTLGGLILTLLLGISPTNPVNLFAMVGIVASAVYLLDVRPAIRDVSNGGGPW